GIGDERNGIGGGGDGEAVVLDGDGEGSALGAGDAPRRAHAVVVDGALSGVDGRDDGAGFEVEERGLFFYGAFIGGQREFLDDDGRVGAEGGDGAIERL